MRQAPCELPRRGVGTDAGRFLRAGPGDHEARGASSRGEAVAEEARATIGSQVSLFLGFCHWARPGPALVSRLFHDRVPVSTRRSIWFFASQADRVPRTSDAKAAGRLAGPTASSTRSRPCSLLPQYVVPRGVLRVIAAGRRQNDARECRGGCPESRYCGPSFRALGRLKWARRGDPGVDREGSEPAPSRH